MNAKLTPEHAPSSRPRRWLAVLLIVTGVTLGPAQVMAQDTPPGDQPVKAGAPAEEAPGDDAPEDGDADEAGEEADGDADAEGSTTGQTEGEGGDDTLADSPARDPEPPVAPGPGGGPADEFERFNQVYLRYQKEIENYREEVNAIVESEYNRKRGEIEEVYDKEIRSLEVLERDRRLDAIAALEEFLRKYPNKKVYTPDVIYRLAELFFEKANDDYLVADENFQEQQELYDMGRIADPPQPPERNYDRSVALFQRLITDFPDYRYVDGAYYLLGFCHVRMGQDAEARQAFVDLIRVRPDSKFVPESWVRIGEYHFDYNELDKAIAAYSNALNYPENTFYDKALYKLAWAYYRADRFDEAIGSFKSLVRYADKKEEETGRSGSELREEAIQYLAISLAEEDWNGDGVPDDDFGMPRVQKYLQGEDKFEPEVLARLGDIFFDNTRYDQAIETYKLSLQRNPLDPENPKVHDKLIIALLRLRRFDEAFEERRKTGVDYGPGSEWYVHQEKEGNVEALAFADSLARDNLIESATWYHEQAQKTAEEAINRSDKELERKATEMFATAAGAYSEYLKKYPHDKESYKWTYYQAECLFYSLQLLDAAKAYANVREMNVGENEFREPAAFNGIKAYENHIIGLVRLGQLPDKAMPQGSLKDQTTAESDSDGGEEPDGRGQETASVTEPEPIPELVQDLNASRERYVELGLTSEKAPDLPGKLEFQVAKVYYDFNHLDEARKRFEKIINTYNNQEVAALSATLILESYAQAKDYENMALWADRISQDPNLATSGRLAEVREEAKRLKLGAMFKQAEELDDGGKYEEAAEAYVALVNSDPKNQYADKALNNAAVAYEKVKRYESAMKLYERVFREYPDSELAPKALFRVAYNAERFFDFEKAVSSYRLLSDKYTQSEDREGALLRAAVLLENLQDYGKAAKVYKEFSREFPDSKEAAECLYQAVLVYEKMGDYNMMISTHNDFRARYGNNSAYNRQVMEGLDKIATYYQKTARDQKNARRTFEAILREHTVRGIAPGSFEAQYAARARFYMTEYEFETWDRIQLKGNLKNQERALKAKFDGAKELRPKYEQVYEYKNLEWTMAAGYRSANILQRFAQTLYDAEVPFEEGSEEYDMYRIQLEDLAIPLEDQAVAAYEKAITKAREEKIVNEWTKKILAELNKYKPAEYPLFHEEMREYKTTLVTPRPPLSDLSSPAEDGGGADTPGGDVDDDGFETGDK